MAKCKNCSNLYNLSNDDDEIVGKWCPKINDSPYIEMNRECDHYKCMTNGDRIRSMTDEELTDIIMCPYDTAGKPENIMPCMTGDGIQDCKKCAMEWLQREVEE